jgi:Sulfite exporter TauE/SafE
VDRMSGIAAIRDRYSATVAIVRCAHCRSSRKSSRSVFPAGGDRRMRLRFHRNRSSRAFHMFDLGFFDLGIHDRSTGALLLLAITAFVAALARGFSGFGSALIFVPLASTAIGPRAAAPLLLIIDGVAAAGLIPGAWRHADKRDVGTMSAGALAGIPLGAWVLIKSDPLLIRWAIALFGTLLLALLMLGWRYSRQVNNFDHRNHRRCSWPAGRSCADRRASDCRLLAQPSHSGRGGAREHCSVLCNHDAHDRHSLSRRRPLDPFGCRIGIDHGPHLWGWALRRRSHVRARQRNRLPPDMLCVDRGHHRSERASAGQLHALRSGQ